MTFTHSLLTLDIRIWERLSKPLLITVCCTQLFLCCIVVYTLPLHTLHLSALYCWFVACASVLHQPLYCCFCVLQPLHLNFSLSTLPPYILHLTAGYLEQYSLDHSSTALSQQFQGGILLQRFCKTLNLPANLCGGLEYTTQSQAL